MASRQADGGPAPPIPSLRALPVTLSGPAVSTGSPGGAHLKASGVDLAAVALMPRSVLDEQQSRWSWAAARRFCPTLWPTSATSASPTASSSCTSSASAPFAPFDSPRPTRRLSLGGFAALLAALVSPPARSCVAACDPVSAPPAVSEQHGRRSDRQLVAADRVGGRDRAGGDDAPKRLAVTAGTESGKAAASVPSAQCRRFPRGRRSHTRGDVLDERAAIAPDRRQDAAHDECIGHSCGAVGYGRRSAEGARRTSRARLAGRRRLV